MLPTELSRLEVLAMNLWWSWDADAVELWREIDPIRFERSRHNPVALLHDVEEERWQELARDPGFRERLDAVDRRFQAYMDSDGWCQRAAPATASGGVAYLCMEFGLHQSIRNYAGGLGVLAGDHMKSASDLAVPITGVSLLYRSGYFVQVLDEYDQLAAYPRADFDRLPIRPLLDAYGKPATVRVPIHGIEVLARVLELHVGRGRILLLDTDLPENHPDERAITGALYGGGHAGRLRQEILLGIGGIRALRAAGADPAIYHLNEGHCAFAILELARERTAVGATWIEALAWVRERCVFTTHTPVPAGHDRFSWHDLNRALGPYRDALGLPRGTFMDLGRVRPGDVDETLCMTVLALRGSTSANGVSALHGKVSRGMWRGLWPQRREEDVPIGHITNGVHPVFWMAPAARSLFDEYIPGWREEVWNAERWREGVESIPAEALWQLRRVLRQRLLDEVYRSTRARLDPEALTLGFARRFAPYKRGNLILSDLDRARALFERGAQIVYAGKAHPADEHGRSIVSDVLQKSASRAFWGKVAFLPDYDIRSGQLITSGSDVWLNNPRRPKEASGTSGQKVPLNGGINLSVRDGWWDEGYTGDNGWAIGDDTEDGPLDQRDARDAASLYQLLEEEVLPLWNDRDNRGIPVGWIRRMRESIATCAPRFTSHRMLRDYVFEAYEHIARRR